MGDENEPPPIYHVMTPASGTHHTSYGSLPDLGAQVFGTPSCNAEVFPEFPGTSSPASTLSRQGSAAGHSFSEFNLFHDVTAPCHPHAASPGAAIVFSRQGSTGQMSSSFIHDLGIPLPNVSTLSHHSDPAGRSFNGDVSNISAQDTSFNHPGPSFTSSPAAAARHGSAQHANPYEGFMESDVDVEVDVDMLAEAGLTTSGSSLNELMAAVSNLKFQISHDGPYTNPQQNILQIFYIQCRNVNQQSILVFQISNLTQQLLVSLATKSCKSFQILH